MHIGFILAAAIGVATFNKMKENDQAKVTLVERLQVLEDEIAGSSDEDDKKKLRQRVKSLESDLKAMKAGQAARDKAEPLTEKLETQKDPDEEETEPKEDPPVDEPEIPEDSTEGD